MRRAQIRYARRSLWYTGFRAVPPAPRAGPAPTPVPPHTGPAPGRSRAADRGAGQNFSRIPSGRVKVSAARPKLELDFEKWPKARHTKWR